MDSSGMVMLSEVPVNVIAATGTRIRYTHIYHAVLNGIVPANKINGRWYVSSKTIKDIPKLMGLDK